MTFEAFERAARKVWAEIPSHFKSGVDGMLVEAEAARHPGLEEVFTMGECVTESWPSDFGGPDTTRSMVVLYHGSFVEVARDTPDFDWDGEIWETLTHELQHHLESLAGDDALEDMDYAADQNFRRRAGESFDPFFFRAGEPVAEGVYRIEDEYFIERPLDGAHRISVPWQDRTIDVELPALDDADIAFVDVIDPADDTAAPLTIVLAREVRGLRAIAALLRPRSPVITHAEAYIA
ncbi:MAG TPA: metallopeptidase family protein [Longimicrobiales bacterium]